MLTIQQVQHQRAEFKQHRGYHNESSDEQMFYLQELLYKKDRQTNHLQCQ